VHNQAIPELCHGTRGGDNLSPRADGEEDPARVLKGEMNRTMFLAGRNMQKVLWGKWGVVDSTGGGLGGQLARAARVSLGWAWSMQPEFGLCLSSGALDESATGIRTVGGSWCSPDNHLGKETWVPWTKDAHELTPFFPQPFFLWQYWDLNSGPHAC
jgi:hypothetical protein